MQLTILKKDGSFYSALLAALDDMMSSNLPSSLKDFIENAASNTTKLKDTLLSEIFAV